MDKLILLKHHRRIVAVPLHKAAERQDRIVLRRQYAIVARYVVLVPPYGFARQLVRPSALTSRRLHGTVEINEQPIFSCVRKRLFVPFAPLGIAPGYKVDLYAYSTDLDDLSQICLAF